jgi:23S rRNA (cytosine1962-C5)-methyltransferase
VQPDSQILCRLFVWEDRPIDGALLAERIRRAADARQGLVDRENTTAWRVVNTEGDELPGLVVDRYGEVLVVQILTAGMARLAPLWCDALEEIFSPAAIFERGERARREVLAGGEPASRVLRGALPPMPFEVRENGLRFLVDLEGGQKTGFYLDQRESRARVGRCAAGREVLNLFGYTGAFSVYAGIGGASKVVQVESSPAARELARLNWSRNGLAPEGLELSGEDVFRFLRHDHRAYDLLILDPPPFAKDRGSLERALRAYKDLNLWAFCRARPGALIWSFSCSQHVSSDLFQKVVFGAARDTGASVQWLGRLGAAPDHPVHLDHPQGEYLKGLWMRVLQPGTPRAPRSVEGAAPQEEARPGEAPGSEEQSPPPESSPEPPPPMSSAEEEGDEE